MSFCTAVAKDQATHREAEKVKAFCFAILPRVRWGQDGFVDEQSASFGDALFSIVITCQDILADSPDHDLAARAKRIIEVALASPYSPRHPPRVYRDSDEEDLWERYLAALYSRDAQLVEEFNP